MLGCGCVLLSGLLTLTLFHCSAESLHVPQERSEYVEPSVVEGRSVQRGQTEQKTSGALNAKLLLHDRLVRLENDVIEPKRKRSFPGSTHLLTACQSASWIPKATSRGSRSSCRGDESSLRSTGLAWAVLPATEDRLRFRPRPDKQRVISQVDDMHDKHTSRHNSLTTERSQRSQHTFNHRCSRAVLSH